MKNVIIIGGGASGLLASITAASKGHKVTLIEKNEKLGKKIYITGKGRCNLTNFCDVNEFLQNVVNNSKFLLSSIHNLSPQKTYEFFEENGLKLKIERGGRVFPLSDKASDVTKTLESILNKLNVEIMLNTTVNDLIVEENVVKGAIINGKKLFSDAVIVCTGGLSYPSTGSTGDGYSFALKTGHNVIKPKPSLCGIELFGSDFLELQGLSLKNVRLTASDKNDKILFTDFGEMLFTHFGISGPIVLSCSAILTNLKTNDINLSIDLKPALDVQTINNRLIKEFSEEGNKQISSTIRGLVPQSLVNLIIKRSNINFRTKNAEITKKQRNDIISTLKNLTFKFKKLRPIDEAIVTSGGIDVKNVNPKTMESKIVSGLYFAGEVLDVDCFTGGYNMQTAFSTGYLAGENV